ncbi:TRAP transporter large permease subunit, partial [Kocuria sp. p3-SID1428]
MISPRQLPGILLAATRTTSIVMMLVGVATIMSWVMSYSRIPQLIAETMLGITESPTLILLVAVGTFLDPTPAILIFTPHFLPIVSEYGVDPIHFGLIVVFAPSLGTITPPVGNVLFVSAKVAGLRIEPVIAALVRLQRCPAGRGAART